VEIVRNLDAPGVHVDALRFIEVDAALANVGVVLVRIPRVVDHAADSSERRLSCDHLELQSAEALLGAD